MRKTQVILVSLMLVIFGFVGCKKEETPPPAPTTAVVHVHNASDMDIYVHVNFGEKSVIVKNYTRSYTVAAGTFYIEAFNLDTDEWLDEGSMPVEAGKEYNIKFDW